MITREEAQEIAQEIAQETFKRLLNRYLQKVSSTPPADGQALVWEVDRGAYVPATPSGTGAPSDATYLVLSSNATLTAEEVVGATPGGELGGTWASPTVDATHSGSAHHAQAHGTSDHTSNGNWKVKHTDGSGDEVELALGAAGTFLRGAGTSAAPTMDTVYAYRTYFFHPLEDPGEAVTAGTSLDMVLSGSLEETVLQVDSHATTTGTAFTFEIEQAAGRVLDGVSWSNLTGDITHTAATHGNSLETTSFTDSTIAAGYKLLRFNISAITGTWKDMTIIMTTRSLIPIA